MYFFELFKLILDILACAFLAEFMKASWTERQKFLLFKGFRANGALF